MSAVINYDGRFTNKYEKDGYKCTVVWLNLYLVPLFVMMSIWEFFLILLIDGFAMLLSTVFPLLLMLYRMETFSDKSRYKDYEMKNLIGPGYVPTVYGMISVILGICITGPAVQLIGTQPM